MIADKLGSYVAAKRKIMPGVEHRHHKGLNNRAGNSPGAARLPAIENSWFCRRTERRSGRHRTIGENHKIILIERDLSHPGSAGLSAP